jgi:Nitroreductase family
MQTMCIDRTQFQAAVAAAVQAPSLHNTQPWRFALREDAIEVRSDPLRSLSVTDPTGWGLRLSCGAATYNLCLAFAVGGTPLEVTWLPEPTHRNVMAVLRPGRTRPATPVEHRLFRAIARRHSNRLPFRSDPVPPAARLAMIEAAREESVWLELVSGAGPLAVVAAIAQAANRVLNRHPEYAAEVAAWTRHDSTALDGVPATAGGPSPEPGELLPRRPFDGPALPPGTQYEREPLVAVLGTRTNGPVDHLVAGYALQRVLLTITDVGLSSSMFSQPIEVASAREELRIALSRYGTPQMVLRIGFGDSLPATPRLPVADVIDVD